jgi:hypothetical protein
MTGKNKPRTVSKLGASIFAIVVDPTPGITLLSARPVARLLHRALWPRSEVPGRPRREPAVSLAVVAE